MKYAKETLFYTFIAIFIATAGITLLAIVGVFRIEQRYLNVLFPSLIVETIGVVIGLYRIQFHDKLPLTFDQARDLSELFMDSTHKELRIAVAEFLSDRLKKSVELKDKNALYNFVYDNTDEIIRRNRANVVHFFLKGGVNFKNFLDKECPLDRGIIGDSKTEVLGILYSVIDANAPLELAAQSVLKITSDAYREDGETLKDKIKKLYSVE